MCVDENIIIKNMLTKLQNVIATRRHQPVANQLTARVFSAYSGDKPDKSDKPASNLFKKKDQKEKKEQQASKSALFQTKTEVHETKQVVRKTEFEKEMQKAKDTGYTTVLHQLNNPLYEMIPQLSQLDNDEFNQDFEGQDIKAHLTLDQYKEWRSNILSVRQLTKSQLNQYQYSQDLLYALEDRLKNDDPEKQAYLESKLKFSKTPYNKIVMKTLQQKGEKTDEHYQKWLERMVKDEEESDYRNPLDSVSIPGGRQFFKHDYQPSNEIDMSPYQQQRKTLTYTQYGMLKDQQIEDIEWKEAFNLNEIYNSEGAAPKVNRRQEENQENKQDPEDLEEENELRIWNLDYPGVDNAAYNDRLQIREQFGSVGPEKGWRFDMPSLDLKRDVQYDRAHELRDGPVYDNDAQLRTEENMQLQAHPDRELMQAAMEMMPPQFDESVDPNYIKIVVEEFDEIKDISVQNVQLREKIAFNFDACRNLYKSVQADRQDLAQSLQTKLDKEVTNQVHTLKHNFLSDFALGTPKGDKAQKLNELRNALKKNQFDPESNRVSDYERELLFISKMAEMTKENKDSTLHRYEFVFDCMKKKGVKMSANIKARVFEYAVQNQQMDLANTMLKTLGQGQVGSEPIMASFLEQYFNASLKRDNFDGVAYLTNYCNKHRVQMGEWNLSNFRSAINYYLNVNFNLSKVMVFTKFYSSFYNARQKTVLSNVRFHSLDESEQETASKAIFRRHEDLVDMRSLFKFLVEQVGKEQMVDPLTRKDALMELIDLFTNNAQFHEVSQKSKNNSLDTQQIAQYLGNQLERPNALENVFKVAKRLAYSTSESEIFAENMLRHLRAYQSKNNGALPQSFSTKAVKNLYLRKRTTEDFKLERASTDELLLYVLKAAKLNEEVIDFCSMPQTLNNVQQFYLSEALMQMDLIEGANYLQVLGQARVIPFKIDDDVKLSASQLVQATKAMFLDQGGLAATKFFENQMKVFKKADFARGEMLLSMYDTVFKSNKEVTEKEFRKIYQRSTKLAQIVAKESYAVHQLSQVVKNKNYNQIEQIFSYYTLIKEERSLRSSVEEYKKQDKMSVWQQKVTEVSERRAVLGHDLSRADMEKLKNIQEAIGNQELTVLNKQRASAVEAYMQMFEGMTLQDAQNIAKRHDKFSKVKIPQLPEGELPDLTVTKDDLMKVNKLHIESDSEDEDYDSQADSDVEMDKMDEFPEVSYDLRHREEQNKVFADFQKVFSDTVNDYLDERGQEMGRPDEEALDEIEQSGILSEYNSLRKDDLKNGAMDDDQLDLPKFNVQYFRHQQLKEDLSTDVDTMDDPEILLGMSYNETMMEMKEHLLKALTHRKQQVLPVALEIFNKIQGKQFKIKAIDDYQRVDSLTAPVENVQADLAKIRYILDDPRSPIISALVESEKYHNQAMIADEFEDQYEHEDQTLTPLDIDHFQRDNERMTHASEELEQLHASLMAMKLKIFKEKCNLTNPNFKDHKSMTPDFDKQYENHVQRLFKQFKNQQQTQVNSKAKVEFMKDALALHLGERYTSNEFPQFYALDLISFGVARKLPDAIRLGEKILASQDGKMPEDIAHSVRQFMLNDQNAKKYRQGMKVGGLSSTEKIYYQNEAKTQPIFCMDDPYWQDFMAKNSRREDIWRTPSIHAWSHKPYGVIGEVINVNRMRAQHEQYNSSL